MNARRLLLALVLVLAPCPALAVETTGTLRGVVQDGSGNPIPGLTVSATSPSLIGGARSTITDEQGRWRLPALPVGDYLVKAEHPGFEPAERRTRVLIGESVPVDFALQLPTVEETFVITESRRAVDTEKTSSGQTLDTDFLDTVPSGRTYQDVVKFVPGVSNAPGEGNPNVHGETLYSNSYLLDGVNITDPVTHTFSTNFNFDAIEAVEIITGGYDAEYGQATGAIMNIVTKSGGNDLTVDGSLYYSDYNLASGGKKTNGDFRDANANINVGGPILRDKIWYFASYEYDDQRVQASEKVSPLTGATVAQPAIFQAHLYLAKLTWQVTSAHKLTLQTQGDPATIKNVDANAALSSNLLFPDAQRIREQGGANYSGTWDWLLNGSTLLRTQLGYVDSKLNEFSERRDFRTPGHTNLDGESTFNSTDFYWDSRRRIVAHTRVTKYLDAKTGGHKIGAGLDWNYDWYPVTSGYGGDTEYIDAGYQTTVPGGPVLTDANGTPLPLPYAKIEYTGTLNSTTKGQVAGLWLQDEWKPRENLVLKIGGRLDYARFENDVGAGIIDFLSFAPRLYVAWDPTKDQKTALTAGYAQSYDNGSLLVPDFVKKRNLGGRVYLWDGSQYAYNSSFGGDGGVVTKKLRPPVKHEVQFSASREVVRDTGVGVRFIASRSLYNFEDDENNLIWNADGSDAIGFKDGVNHVVYSLGTPAIAYRDYRGLELTVTRNLQGGLFLSGSYTMSDTRGTSDAPITTFLDNPTQNRYLVDSKLPYNVGHAFKLQTTRDLPGNVTLGMAYSFETGQGYDKLFYNTYDGAYSDYRARRGQFQYSPTHAFDLRAQWSTKIASRNELTLMADLFNVLDRREVVQRRQDFDETLGDDDPGQTFGRVLDRQSPFNARIGVRYEF